jgi:hypothetical protein
MPMRTKSQILEEFRLFAVPTGGIGAWLTEGTHNDVFDRLGKIDGNPLSAVQLNQLLVLGHEAPASDGLFRYYWLLVPANHPYRVQDVPGFAEHWIGSTAIASLEHLKWGLYRLYIDALLFFGNVRTAFRQLRDLQLIEIEEFFKRRRFDTEAVKRRGPSLPLKPISKDNRYLISEMACKSYGDSPDLVSDLQKALTEAFRSNDASGNPSPTIRQLLVGRVSQTFQDRQQEFIFSADDFLAVC